jgi:hypothetical protein
VFVHFPDPAAPGDLVRIWIRWSWPRFYRTLLDGGTEPVEWTFRRTMTDFCASLTFDRAITRGNKLLVTPYNGSPSPDQVIQPDGSVKINAQYSNLPRDRTVGFRIERAQSPR